MRFLGIKYALSAVIQSSVGRNIAVYKLIAMSHFLTNPQVFNQSLRLSDQERKAPYAVLMKYCNEYSLSELRYTLWEIVSACLTSDNPYFSDAGDRANLLTWYEKTEELIEAIYILQLKSPTQDGIGELS